MTLQSIEVTGLGDIQRRIALLGDRIKPGGLERPSVDIAKRLIASNRARLGRGVDVQGRALRSNLAKRLGLVPLGGEYGLFARSVRAQVVSRGGDGVDLYSTFIGANVAYKGKTITPRTRQYLTIPLEARGGEFSTSDSGGFLGAGLSMKDNRGKRAGHFENTFFMRTDGKLFLVQNDKRKKYSGANSRKLRFLFLLVRSVRYPKNEWLGVSDSDMAMAADIYGRHLNTFEGGTL